MTTNEQVALALGWTKKSGWEEAIDYWITPNKEDRVYTLPDFLHSWSECEAIWDWFKERTIDIRLEYFHDRGESTTEARVDPYGEKPCTYGPYDDKGMLALCEAIVAWDDALCKGCGKSFSEKNTHYMDKRYCGMCKPKKEIADA